MVRSDEPWSLCSIGMWELLGVTFEGHTQAVYSSSIQLFFLDEQAFCGQASRGRACSIQSIYLIPPIDKTYGQD